MSKRPERQDGASGGGGVGRVGSSTSTRLTPLTGVLMTDAAGGLVVRRVRAVEHRIDAAAEDRQRGSAAGPSSARVVPSRISGQ